MKSKATIPNLIVPSGARTTTRRRLMTGAAATGAATLLAGRERAASAQALEGSVTMRIWTVGAQTESVYNAVADDFEAENPGVEVNIEVVPGADRYPKMLADLAAGQGPDVMFITTDALIRFAEAGVIAPLDEVVAEDVWADFRDASIEEVTWQGSRWIMPYDQEMPVWMVNNAILEQAGFDPAQPPGTWDEIRAVCQSVKDVGGGALYGWGYEATLPTLNMTFYPFLYQAGGRAISDDGSEPVFNSDAGVEALEFIVELFDEGWISPHWLSPVDGVPDPFQVGTQAISSFGFLAAYQEMPEVAPEIEVGVTPILAHHEQWGFGSLRSFAMSSTARNPEAAAAFLNFLARPENVLRHSEALGVYPARVSIVDQAFANSPELAAMSDRLPLLFGEQKHKYGRDMMPPVIAEIQAAILKEKEPRQALDDAAAAVREIFAQG